MDVIANLRDSKKIRGPIKGPATTMRLVNKTKDGDTLEVTFYGNNNSLGFPLRSRRELNLYHLIGNQTLKRGKIQWETKK